MAAANRRSLARSGESFPTGRIHPGTIGRGREAPVRIFPAAGTFRECFAPYQTEDGNRVLLEREPDHPDTVADAVAWCGLLDGLNRQTESLPIYRGALKYYEERFGPSHFEVAATLNNLGMALVSLGALAEGRGALERCLSIKRKLFERHHPEVQLTGKNLAEIAGAAPSTGT